MLCNIIESDSGWVIALTFFAVFGMLWSLIAELNVVLDINAKINKQQEEKEWIQNKVKDVVDNKQLTRKDKIVRLTMLVHEERNNR